MTLFGFTSRNIPNPQTYENMLEDRMKAKKSGDMATANALKLVANTTYGAMLNKYNDLCDPLMGRSVCITGQLFLYELAQNLYQNIPDLKVVALNTDGIMIEFDDSYYQDVQDILNEWQTRTGFELEEDLIKSLIQKDINNYIEIPYDGKPKIKGGYLVRGIAPAGAFNVNNNATIVSKAIIEYFVNGTPVEKTINECTDIFCFQIIAKAGSKYKEAYHLVNGQKVPVQKVNRIYATADERYGKIYKVKAENEQNAKIESLPEHCIIDNDNQLSIESVDKSFYIDLARKRINDFLGIKPEKKGRKKKMAETKKVENIYSKLAKARIDFANEGVKKSGKNLQLTSKYFELEDIVPVATPIFANYNLLPLVNFYHGRAVLKLLDIGNPEEFVEFETEVILYDGNRSVTPTQAYGAVITYYRRYLYMIALDIVEADTLEPMTEAPTPKPPVKTETRAEVTKTLTNAEGNATELQITQLKKVLKELKEKHPESEGFITQVALDTKAFTVVSKADCEKYIEEVGKMLG